MSKFDKCIQRTDFQGNDWESIDLQFPRVYGIVVYSWNYSSILSKKEEEEEEEEEITHQSFYYLYKHEGINPLWFPIFSIKEMN